MDTDSKIIARLRKLLSLASDQEGTPEGETAARLASKLMRENAISASQIGTEEEISEKSERIGRSVWKRRLFWALARHCSCRAIYFKNGTVRIIGHNSDIEIFDFLADICVREINRGAFTHRERFPRASRGEVSVLLRNFRDSAVAGLSSKLYAMRQEEKGEPGTSLVLARGQKAEAAMNERYTVSYPKLQSRDFCHAGFDHGKSIQLNDGIGSSSKTGVTTQ